MHKDGVESNICIFLQKGPFIYSVAAFFTSIATADISPNTTLEKIPIIYQSTSLSYLYILICKKIETEPRCF